MCMTNKTFEHRDSTTKYMLRHTWLLLHVTLEHSILTGETVNIYFCARGLNN
jgi:hypothetical protein